MRFIPPTINFQYFPVNYKYNDKIEGKDRLFFSPDNYDFTLEAEKIEIKNIIDRIYFLIKRIFSYKIHYGNEEYLVPKKSLREKFKIESLKTDEEKEAFGQSLSVESLKIYLQLLSEKGNSTAIEKLKYIFISKYIGHIESQNDKHVFNAVNARTIHLCLIPEDSDVQTEIQKLPQNLKQLNLVDWTYRGDERKRDFHIQQLSDLPKGLETLIFSHGLIFNDKNKCDTFDRLPKLKTIIWNFPSLNGSRERGMMQNFLNGLEIIHGKRKDRKVELIINRDLLSSEELQSIQDIVKRKGITLILISAGFYINTYLPVALMEFERTQLN